MSELVQFRPWHQVSILVYDPPHIQVISIPRAGSLVWYGMQICLFTTSVAEWKWYQANDRAIRKTWISISSCWKGTEAPTRFPQQRAKSCLQVLLKKAFQKDCWQTSAPQLSNCWGAVSGFKRQQEDQIKKRCVVLWCCRGTRRIS